MVVVTIRMAILGDLDPNLPSHHAIEEARGRLPADVEAAWVPTSRVGEVDWRRCDAVWLAPAAPATDAAPGGYVDSDAAYRVIRWARTLGIPFLACGAGAGYVLADFVVSVLDRPDLVPSAARLDAEVVDGLARSGWVARPDPTGRPLAAGPAASRSPGPPPRQPALAALSLAGHPSYIVVPSSVTLDDPVLTTFLDAARRQASRREQAEADAARRAALVAAELKSRTYPQQLRGPRHRWWKPLASLPLVAILAALGMTLVMVPFAIVTDGGPDSFDDTAFAATPLGALWLNLTVAALIPATFLGIWLVHRRPPGRILSVTGRVRWAWLLRAHVTVLPLWVVYLGGTWVLTGQEILPRPREWLGLLVVTVLTTPLQAAAEEVGMRGGLVQAIGSWFAQPVVAAVVSGAVSTAAFIAAHGSLDPWIWVDLGSMAVAACYLAWRTGGLEAAIAIHVVNNLLVTFSGIVFGGLEESYVSEETVGSPGSALASVIVIGVATGLLVWQGRRVGVVPARRFAPALG